ncbi:MAG: hypothetical protein PHC68_07240 [Syntrophorhabdaceae bacterium]|nr:hypothetical protein [Syntrophorhabdaceae bacterium]
MNNEYLTVKEVAALFRTSVSFIHQNWPAWIEYGVRPIRLNGAQKGRLMWKKSELLKMAEKEWRVK